MSAPMLMFRPRPSRRVNSFSRYMRKTPSREDKSNPCKEANQMTADDTSTGHTVAPDRDRSDPIDAEYTVIDVPAVSAAVEVGVGRF